MVLSNSIAEIIEKPTTLENTYSMTAIVNDINTERVRFSNFNVEKISPQAISRIGRLIAANTKAINMNCSGIIPNEDAVYAAVDIIFTKQVAKTNLSCCKKVTNFVDLINKMNTKILIKNNKPIWPKAV